MMDRKKQDEYSLKIREISKYQEEANKYKRLSILGGLFAGANTLLSINSLIMGSFDGKSSVAFFGFLLHAAFMGLGFTYMYEMNDNKRDCDQKVAELKKDIQEYKKI